MWPYFGELPQKVYIYAIRVWWVVQLWHRYDSEIRNQYGDGLNRWVVLEYGKVFNSCT